MTPQQAALAAQILSSQKWMPMHVGRFKLARHPWDEPFRIIGNPEGKIVAGKSQAFTPIMGQIVNMMDPKGDKWWDLP